MNKRFYAAMAPSTLRVSVAMEFVKQKLKKLKKFPTIHLPRAPARKFEKRADAVTPR